MATICASGGLVKRGIYVFLGLLLSAMPANVQVEPEPYPPDVLLKGILDFREPTALPGKILY